MACFFCNWSMAEMFPASLCTILKRSLGAVMFATVLSICVNATLLTPQASSKAQHANTSAIIIFGLKVFLLLLAAVIGPVNGSFDEEVIFPKRAHFSQNTIITQKY